MDANAARPHIAQEPIYQWVHRLGVTDTTGHDQLIGQTLRIHGKGAFEVDRIEGGEIYLKGKDRPIPISVLTDKNGMYSARRADGSQFAAKVNVVTGNSGARSQEELHQSRRPRKSISSKRQIEQLNKVGTQISATDVEETNNMFLQSGIGFKEVRAFDSKKTDTQAFIAVTPDEKGIVIAFRGTTPGKDIWTDLRVSFDDFALGGQAHEGFQNYVCGVKNLMYEHLDKVMQMYPEAKIFGAGHSLGAAAVNNFIGTALGEGVIEAARVGRMVLAGCPRGLDMIAARRFNRLIRKKVDRCVNASDVVTKVPAVFASVIASVLALFQRNTHPGFYKHIGTFAPNVFFDRRSRETADWSWVYRIRERIYSLRGQVTDHALDNYLKCGYSWAREKERLPAQNVSQRLAPGAN
ncbi:hypothetical protein NKDENANG_00969 [Candidatus Entotheonellaceae bacterium PAL068K]